MKFCPECGAKLKNATPHCPECGYALKKYGKSQPSIFLNQKVVIAIVIAIVAVTMIVSYFVSPPGRRSSPQMNVRTGSSSREGDDRLAKLALEVPCTCGCGREKLSSCTCEDVQKQMDFLADGIQKGLTDDEIKKNYMRNFAPSTQQGQRPQQGPRTPEVPAPAPGFP